jgi:hypothetical protein
LRGATAYPRRAKQAQRSIATYISLTVGNRHLNSPYVYIAPELDTHATALCPVPGRIKRQPICIDFKHQNGISSSIAGDT